MNQTERYQLSSELLRTFLTVAESGNVTRAAALLGRTQSAISVQIRKLEEALSTRLFERQARGMVLTEDGRALVPSARRAITEIHRICTQFARPLRGRIRVGIPDDYDEMILERVLADFGRRHPEVEIYARSGCTAGFPNAVAAGDLDVAVSSGADIRPEDAFHSEPTIWAAGTDFALPPDAAVPLACLDRQCWWRDIPTDALDGISRPWKRAYVSASFASIKAAIRAGLAVGILPFGAVDRSMRVLGANDGFPALPPTRRTLLCGKTAPASLTEAMVEAIRGAQFGRQAA